MARYINADKLCEALKNMAAVQEPYKQNTILGVVSSIENFPTADVVPKSEVEQLTTLNSQLEAKVWEERKEKSEVAREFIKACDSMLSLVCEMTGLEMTFFGNYAKLKKKYTEGKTDEKDT